MEAVALKSAVQKTHAEDQTLIEQAILGNQQAFTALMIRHQHTVKRTIQKMVTGQEDVEDLVQEAFGKAFQNLDSYRPHFAFSTWLHRIAVNHCIDHLRRKKRISPFVDIHAESLQNEEFASSMAASVLNPEEIIIRQQRHEHMRKLMLRLSPRYREILELHYFDGLSYEEIAQAMGTPMGTIKAQLHRAREAMWVMLQKK